MSSLLARHTDSADRGSGPARNPAKRASRPCFRAFGADPSKEAAGHAPRAAGAANGGLGRHARTAGGGAGRAGHEAAPRAGARRPAEFHEARPQTTPEV